MTSRVVYRPAVAADVPALDALIAANLVEGHLLPRSIEDLESHAPRFTVAVRQGLIVGCAELAPLSQRMAEIRSLVVARGARGLGIGTALVAELERRGRLHGFEHVCAFTHDAGYFLRLGFSIVPHAWVPEKIARDCHGCSLFRRCGQHAVLRPLTGSQQPRTPDFVPLAGIRG